MYNIRNVCVSVQYEKKRYIQAAAEKYPLRFFFNFSQQSLEFKSEILMTYLVILCAHNGIVIM